MFVKLSVWQHTRFEPFLEFHRKPIWIAVDKIVSMMQTSHWVANSAEVLNRPVADRPTEVRTYIELVGNGNTEENHTYVCETPEEIIILIETGSTATTPDEIPFY